MILDEYIFEKRLWVGMTGYRAFCTQFYEGSDGKIYEVVSYCQVFDGDTNKEIPKDVKESLVKSCAQKRKSFN